MLAVAGLTGFILPSDVFGAVYVFDFVSEELLWFTVIFTVLTVPSAYGLCVVS